MGNHPLTSKTPIQTTNPNRAGSNRGAQSKEAAEHLQPPPGRGPEYSRRGGQGERRGSAETSAW